MSSESPTGSEAEIINHSTADILSNSVQQETETGATSADNSIPQRPPPLSRASTASREKCWICLSTKDEDPPSPPNPLTEWRAPCACSLQAHEQCLLDWVADQESPQRRNGRTQTAPDRILCPQCRSEIKIQRPTDPVVALCRYVDKQYSRLVLPGIAASLVGTVFSGCWAYGRLATWCIFGTQHDQQIWRFAQTAGKAQMASYGLIPICLIFSRTSYADFVMPLGTVTLLSTQLPLTDPYGQYIAWDAPWWPPLPSTTFIVLPTIMTAYDWLYQKAFGALNKKWMAEILPRQEDNYADRAGNIADVLNEAENDQEDEGVADGDVVFAVDINLGPVEVEVGAQDEDDILDRPPNGAAEAGDGAAAQRNQNQGAARNNAGGRINEYITDTQKILGSLLLPVAARFAGEALRLVLPQTWVSPRWNYYPSSRRVGFFATQWGRAVAGGLAFCFLKDMFLTYCRWRLADTHNKRKIMNFDKVNKRYVSV